MIYSVFGGWRDGRGRLPEYGRACLPHETLALMKERHAARKEGNFELADYYRGLLSVNGIVVSDTRNGFNWTGSIRKQEE